MTDKQRANKNDALKPRNGQKNKEKKLFARIKTKFALNTFHSYQRTEILCHLYLYTWKVCMPYSDHTQVLNSDS